MFVTSPTWLLLERSGQTDAHRCGKFPDEGNFLPWGPVYCCHGLPLSAQQPHFGTTSISGESDRSASMCIFAVTDSVLQREETETNPSEKTGTAVPEDIARNQSLRAENSAPCLGDIVGDNMASVLVGDPSDGDMLSPPTHRKSNPLFRQSVKARKSLV
jgi:hypothetical protein